MSKKSSANFKVLPTNFVNLFKITGLVLLSLFTFYFIYNYLTTGSFDLRPSASEVSCASRITSTTCTDGCVWTPPKYKSVTVDCSDNDCKSGEGGCKFVNKTTTTYTYQCEEPGLTAQKCQSLGFAWQKIPKTTTTRVCEGTRSDLTEISAGICSGTPNRPPPVVVVNPTPGTCSLGNTQCSADGTSLQVCTGNGVWTTNPCPSGSVCSMGKCTASAPPKCADVCIGLGVFPVDQTTKNAIGCTDNSNKITRCCPKGTKSYSPAYNECVKDTANSGKNVPGNAIPAKVNVLSNSAQEKCTKSYPGSTARVVVQGGVSPCFNDEAQQSGIFPRRDGSNFYHCCTHPSVKNKESINQCNKVNVTLNMTIRRTDGTTYNNSVPVNLPLSPLRDNPNCLKDGVRGLDADWIFRQSSSMLGPGEKLEVVSTDDKATKVYWYRVKPNPLGTYNVFYKDTYYCCPNIAK